jgi:Flp pilus assembly protein TadG
MLSPLLIVILLGVAIAVGRQSDARLRVDAAAQTAARAASTARTPASALTAAQTALAGQDTTHACQPLTVSITTVGGFVPGGTIRAAISCRVSLIDITGVRLPGQRTISSTAYAPLDRFRSISGGMP